MHETWKGKLEIVCGWENLTLRCFVIKLNWLLTKTV